jgi:hypothetical protein
MYVPTSGHTGFEDDDYEIEFDSNKKGFKMKTIREEEEDKDDCSDGGYFSD